MMSDHDKAADRLARILGSKHRHVSVDILVNGKAIEVAVSDDDIRSSVKQCARAQC